MRDFNIFKANSQMHHYIRAKKYHSATFGNLPSSNIDDSIVTLKTMIEIEIMRRNKMHKDLMEKIKNGN